MAADVLIASWFPTARYVRECDTEIAVWPCEGEFAAQFSA
jgi:hypothetical protein